MLNKLIKYRKEAPTLGKNPDSIDDFVLWMEEHKYKLENEKVEIQKQVASDIDVLIKMEEDKFSELLNISPYTAEVVLLMLEADKNKIVKASTYDDFFMIIDDDDIDDDDDTDNDNGC